MLVTDEYVQYANGVRIYWRNRDGRVVTDEFGQLYVIDNVGVAGIYRRRVGAINMGDMCVVDTVHRMVDWNLA